MHRPRSRRARATAVLLALSLVAAQWLLGRTSAGAKSPCAIGACPPREQIEKIATQTR